jgi:DNA recombination protein RmuC
MDGLIIGLLIFLILICIDILVHLIKKKKENIDPYIEVVQGYSDNIREHINNLSNASDKNIATVINLRSEMLGNNINELAKVERDNAHQMREFLMGQMTDTKNTVGKSLGEIRADTNRQLDNMRQIVDKTLVETLDARLKSSYEIISKNLNDVASGFREIQKLSSGVTDLNKVFSNVKSRGIWGEIMLNTLLEQMLSVASRLHSQEQCDGNLGSATFTPRPLD